MTVSIATLCHCAECHFIDYYAECHYAECSGIIRIGWKFLTVTNTLAYYNAKYITAVFCLQEWPSGKLYKLGLAAVAELIEHSTS